MSITSFYFLILLFAGAIVYYILPRSCQWFALLVMSLIFYFTSAVPYTIIYLIISTATAYIATMFISNSKDETEGKSDRIAVTFGVLAVLINLGLWFLLKARGIWEVICLLLAKIVPVCGKIPTKIDSLQLVAALGMGYYTLQVIGYILDCYWGNAKAQKNPLKLFLFVCFFPQMTTGPISRYNQMQQLYEKHSFSYENLCFGSQRILWGFFKKLVLAERVGIIVNAIWASMDSYVGFWRWIALILYPIQMYADFSGCMDIILGAAEIFDIHLPENFNAPFLSKTIQEFWQRWHITLGTWAKDYVLYPLLKSRFMVNFSKISKKKFGKKMGKFIATAAGMFVLWMVMGIWHGGFRYIVGVSLWYWLLLMSGELCRPYFKKLTTVFRLPVESFSWHMFQSLRTYFIYAIGAAFFRASGTVQGIKFIRGLAGVFNSNICNPWIFFDGSILNLGVTYMDLSIILLSVFLLVLAGVLRENYGHARSWISDQFILFRWLIWIGLFVFVLILGEYGPGYDAVQFIYQDF